MTQLIRSRRLQRCERCGLSTELCFCASLPRLRTRTELVLLMHKNELAKTSNTGRLALAALERSRLSIRGQLGLVQARPGPERRLVLFPAPDARELGAADGAGDRPLTLVVPDGSWKQARRMLAREAWTSGAEVVRLPAPVRSRYDLRRQPRAGSVCTFEAVASALGVLEGPDVERALLQVLDAFLVRARHMRSSGGALVGHAG